MKAVFISYNQALTEKVDYIMDTLGIRGYTQWIGTCGRGTNTGDPHMNTHTWPESNSSILTIVEDEKVDVLLKGIKALDNINIEVGIRAFVWNIEKMV